MSNFGLLVYIIALHICAQVFGWKKSLCSSAPVRVNKEIMNYHCFKRSVDKTLINFLIVLIVSHSLKVLTFWNFPGLPKTCKFWICFSVL